MFVSKASFPILCEEVRPVTRVRKRTGADLGWIIVLATIMFGVTFSVMVAVNIRVTITFELTMKVKAVIAILPPILVLMLSKYQKMDRSRINVSRRHRAEITLLLRMLKSSARRNRK